MSYQNSLGILNEFPFRWKYRAVITQTAAGGGNNELRAKLGEGQLMLITALLLGADDQAAGRTNRINVLDQESTPNQGPRWASLSIDNQLINIPGTEDLAADAVADTTSALSRLIYPTDTLDVVALSLAQNETFKIFIRALINTQEKPTIDTSDSTGTVTVSTTYDDMV